MVCGGDCRSPKPVRLKGALEECLWCRMPHDSATITRRRACGCTSRMPCQIAYMQGGSISILTRWTTQGGGSADQDLRPTAPPVLPGAACKCNIVIWHGVQCADQPPLHHSCADHHPRAASCVLHGPGQWRALQHRQRREFSVEIHTITPQRRMSNVLVAPIQPRMFVWDMYACCSHSCGTMCPSTYYA